ncbi:MAG: hypothetical protein V4635_03010 [Bacteroidota bacterium]
MRLQFYLSSALVTIALLFTGCRKSGPAVQAPPPLPYGVVSTSPVNAIAEISARCGGNVSFEGLSALTAVGVCWDVNPSPTILRPHTNDGAGTGSFESVLTGLEPDTKYYVRAYATNASGTNYGQEVSFRTLPKWVNLIPQSQFADQIRCIVSTGSDLFIGGNGFNGNLRKSTDNGTTFTTLNNGITGVINAMFVQGSTLFAATSNGLFKSTDGGVSFASADNGIPAGSMSSIGALGSRLFAGTGGDGLYYSVDNGDNWIEVTDTDILNNYISEIVVLGTNVFVVAGNFTPKLFLSTDSGLTWDEVSQDLPLNNSNISEVFVNGTALYACVYGVGIYKTTDNGDNWTMVSNGLTNNLIYNSVQKGSVLIVGTQGSGAFLSSDEGANWSPINAGLPGNASISALGKNNTSVFTAVNGGLYRRNIQ